MAEHLDSLFGRVQRALLTDLMGLGRFDDFDAELDVFAAYAESLRAPGDRYWASAHIACRRLMISPEGETEELINAARTLGRRLEQADAEGTFILQNFALRYQQNRAPEVVPTLDESASPHPRILAGTAILAATFAAAGHHDPAIRLLDGAVRDGRITLPRDNLWLAATALYGAVAAEVGDPQQRAAIGTALAPYAEHWCVFGAGGAVVGTGHHWLGLLSEAEGDSSSAQRHFVRAAELSERARSPYWAAQARDHIAIL